MKLIKRTWTCKDADGCAFKATLLQDADGHRRYYAFGRLLAVTLAGLKLRVAVGKELGTIQ